MIAEIVINLNVLNTPLTGIGYYTLNIIKILINNDITVLGIKNGYVIPSRDVRDLVLHLSTPTQLQLTTKQPDGQIQIQHLKHFIINLIKKIPKAYLIKKNLESYRLKKSLLSLSKKGVVYFETNFVPLPYPGKTVTTIHDLSFIHNPEFHPKERVEYLKKQLPNTMQQSYKIVVDSNTIATELSQMYPQYKDKIVTLYLGVNPEFNIYQKNLSLLSQFNLKEKSFILSVCTLEPRKNLLGLVKAYKLLPENIKNNFPLVLVGHKGWKNSELYSHLESLLDKKQVIITGYLSDEDVKAIYASAKIFAYVSLYEGFGLPIIEAMASGTPVITSNYGAMAEVAGDAAVLVNTTSTEEISTAILDLINNDTLCSHLSTLGLKRANYFRWEKTVDQLLSILKN
ncbi:glycosyltransferase family 4 protein [Gallibacterium salpingitidis]|uniref:glycosyltransferase family 4 protein n=1 Tax=Gallibacterium salpingitidis TaxID=505341 RepID=UPI0026709F79|nr:glycosyltransferase family 1 protein [Gallibacterium salpingitidis]WKT00459.1 glycosyltransferase family 4 protein [Gallibacterium salpingitidis]